MSFPSTPRSMMLDDLELLFRIFGEFRTISQICQATANEETHIVSDSVVTH